MDILQAMHARHSVRAFTGQAIPPSSVQALQEELARSNAESGLDLRLITDEPQAFSCFLAHYGKFSNVRNYIAVIGDKTLYTSILSVANDFCLHLHDLLVEISSKSHIALANAWFALHSGQPSVVDIGSYVRSMRV